MKKFMLVISIRDNVFYKDIISFTEEQEENFLFTLTDIRDVFRFELEAVCDEIFSEKSEESKRIQNLGIEALVRDYPDLAICVGLREKCYPLFSKISDLAEKPWEGMGHEIVKTDLEQYQFHCERID